MSHAIFEKPLVEPKFTPVSNVLTHTNLASVNCRAQQDEEEKGRRFDFSAPP